jgi:hypothetical protein
MKIFDIIWKVSVLSALVVFGCLIVNYQEDIHRSIRSDTYKDFDYEVVWIADKNFDTSMDLYGSNRWELVTARRAKGEYDDYGYECIFKRANSS